METWKCKLMYYDTYYYKFLKLYNRRLICKKHTTYTCIQIIVTSFYNAHARLYIGLRFAVFTLSLIIPFTEGKPDRSRVQLKVMVVMYF